MLKFAVLVPTAICAKSSSKCADATPRPLGFVASAARCQLRPSRSAWRPSLNANSLMKFSRRSRRRGQSPRSLSLFLKKILPRTTCQLSKFLQSGAISNRKIFIFLHLFQLSTSSLANDETRIKLPGGTVIRIGEEKPDSSSSKPGRKRKGEIVIKEVIEAKVPTIRPKRDRKLPKRFQRSPNKSTQKVKKAVSRLRKQLNVDRARSKDEVKEEKVEAKTEPVQLSPIVKTEPPTGAIIIQQNGRRLSHKSDKSENSTLPSVIIKSATPLAIPVPVTCSSSKGAPTSVIQSPPVAQSCTIVTLPVTQVNHLSTFFLVSALFSR